MLVAVFLGGGLSTFAFQEIWAWSTACHETYDLVNPSSLCRHQNGESGEWDYEPLRKALIAKIDALQAANKVSHLSIYFRDLHNGPRFGIQESADFHTASLLKVPIMIALLHVADQQPSLLDEQITSPKVLSAVSNVEQPDETIQPNTTYSVRELLRRMIVYSDNDSAYLLVDKMNSIPMFAHSNIFLDLGLQNMMDGTMDNISMLSYGNLFPLLYNTAYLSNANSQLALSLLSQSTYKDGLVAGVPSDVRVANKFGYYIVSANESQLHDCGIIYHATTPYMLCVMTSGSNITDEASSIAEVSRIVYNTVDGLHFGSNKSLYP